MNILVVCHYGLYQDLSFSFVHNQIREYVSLGHRVRVIIPNGMGKLGRDGKRLGKMLLVSEADGVELYDLRYLTASRYGEKGFNTRSAIASVRCYWKRLFGDFAPDVIHAHTLGFDSDLGAWLKKKFGCPLVVTTHGSDTAVPLAKGEHGWLREKCGKADVVVSVSSALEKKVRSCGTETPLKTILNGFVFRDMPENVPRDPFKMIQVCHLIPLKRVNVTIQALAKLRKTNPQMTLTVIGQGYQRPELEALCRELNVADAVCFLGQLPNHRVFEELASASYFVMASKPEGFGIAYLEAMSAGCVTVGTEGEGIADLIVNGENGFLVSADDPDAIVRTVATCVAREAEAASIARSGMRSARELTWRKNAEQYLALFWELRRG